MESGGVCYVGDQPDDRGVGRGGTWFLAVSYGWGSGRATIRGRGGSVAEIGDDLLERPQGAR